MKIQIISHTIKENENRMTGRWSILPYYFEKQGNEVDHILRHEWFSFLKRYKTFKPNVIITVGPVGAFVALLKKIGLVGVPVIHDWNDNYSEIMGNKYGKTFVSFLEKFVVKNSDFVVSPSYWRIKKAKPLNRNLLYLPHGYYQEYFKKIRKINLPGKNNTKIVYVGEQSGTKKVDKLIEAVENFNVDLILIGKINEEYRKKASKNIYFLGVKKPREIPSYLRASDFLVVTEDNDSALKLIEYLKSKKPIVAPFGRITDSFREKRIIGYDIMNGEFIKKIVNLKKIDKTDLTEIMTWNGVATKYIGYLNKKLR